MHVHMHGLGGKLPVVGAAGRKIHPGRAAPVPQMQQHGEVFRLDGLEQLAHHLHVRGSAPMVFRAQAGAEGSRLLAIAIVNLGAALNLLVAGLLLHDAKVDAHGLRPKQLGRAQAFLRATVAGGLLRLILVPNMGSVAAEVDQLQPVLLHLLLDQLEIALLIAGEHAVPDVGRIQVVAVAHRLKVMEEVHRARGQQAVERVGRHGKTVCHGSFLPLHRHLCLHRTGIIKRDTAGSAAGQRGSPAPGWRWTRSARGSPPPESPCPADR